MAPISYTGRGVDITDGIREFFEGKIDKLPHIEMATSIHVEIGQTIAHKGKAKDFYVRVLVSLPRAQVRYKKEGDEVYALMDSMVPSLKNKLVKYKDNFRQWEGEEAWPEAKVVEDYTEDKDRGYTSAMYSGYMPPVRRKVFDDMTPMSVTEAVERMELLDKNFFVFKDIQTSKVTFLGKNKEGEYEVITTE